MAYYNLDMIEISYKARTYYTIGVIYRINLCIKRYLLLRKTYCMIDFAYDGGKKSVAPPDQYI